MRLRLRLYATCRPSSGKAAEPAVPQGQFRLLKRLVAFQNNQRVLGYWLASALHSCSRRCNQPLRAKLNPDFRARSTSALCGDRGGVGAGERVVSSGSVERGYLNSKVNSRCHHCAKADPSRASRAAAQWSVARRKWLAARHLVSQTSAPRGPSLAAWWCWRRGSVSAHYSAFEDVRVTVLCLFVFESTPRSDSGRLGDRRQRGGRALHIGDVERHSLSPLTTTLAASHLLSISREPSGGERSFS
jgi:hypothetical protein